MIFISVIPGQERRNAKFIINNNIGVIPDDFDSLVDTVRQWKDSPKLLREMKERIKQLSHSDTTREILKTSYNIKRNN